MKSAVFNISRCLMCIIAVLLSTYALSQKKPFREITVDLDEFKIDSLLPIEEPFYLRLISNTNFSLANYRLVRTRTRRSYIPFVNSTVLYYKDIEFTTRTTANGAVTLPKASKATITNSTKTAATTETTHTTVVEYSTTPTTGTKYWATIFVPALNPNFYYYLVHVAGTAVDLHSLNMFTVIEAPTTIPLGNTALDPSENLNRHITATFGLAYLKLPNSSITPYLGLRYNFLPVNKWVRQGMAEMSTSGSARRLLDRFAFDVGLTINSIEDPTNKVKDLTGKLNLITAVGFRVSNHLYISAGPVWYKLVNASSGTNVHSRFSTSLSYDWDIAKTFNSFGKLLGVSF